MTLALRAFPGWSTEVWDICWLDCPNEGFYKQSGAYEICLCLNHIEELEAKADVSKGYSKAARPSDSVALRWPWRRKAR